MSPRVDLTTRLRLASGLVLMAFAASHLVNHALGIHSLQAMEQGRAVFVAFWRSPPGTLVLFGALFGHMALALLKLYRRRSLRMPPWEIAQIGLGVLIPFWLTVHVVGTFGIHLRFGVEDDYVYLLDLLWPGGAGRQSLMLLIVWLHGCIGIHFWLRIRPWYRAAQPLFLAAALLLPTLSLLGFVNGGREVRAQAAADPAWLEAQAAAGDWPDAAERAWIYETEDRLLLGFGVVLLAVVGGRGLRALRQRYRGQIRLRYPGGLVVAVAPGMSVLEASRSVGIPHASVCGGRGRCSTCRVRIGEGAGHLPPPAADEARVLARIGATDGSVRLACQLRPSYDLEVVPLLPAGAGPGEVRVQVNPGQGIEREIAVLFADLRAFTRMAEGRLPYDVVFVLNRYFQAMGQAIEDAGGRVDKFIGDGIMALFGVDLEPDEACRRALAGARAMALALDELNRELEHDLREPLRIGIGLHAGAVILGEMGYRRATSLTAIGDPVNVASRLEALTKELGVQLVVSARLAERAGVDLARFELRQIEIRGRRRPLRIRVVEDARTFAGRRRGGGAACGAVLGATDPARAAPAAAGAVRTPSDQLEGGSAMGFAYRWRRGGSAAVLVAGLALAAETPAGGAEVPVDLELVLAVDISGSVDRVEARLQREGYIAALRHPEVVAAIQGGMFGRIALAYVEWAGDHYQRTMLDWTVIEDAAGADAFADALAETPLMTAHWTSISGAIDYAAPLFESNGIEGVRRVIDISGDGYNNRGRPVQRARDDAVAAGITINGLPIVNDRPNPWGSRPPADLDRYYEELVIGGPGAFIVVAEDYTAFASAILSKLLLEIAGEMPPPRSLAAAAP